MEILKKGLQQQGFSITTDASKFQFDVIHGYLTRSYWSKGIPMEIVKKAVQNSFGFGVFHNGQQVGFARLITDFTIFAHLADVFILEQYRGKGLSKWLMHEILNHPLLQGLRKWTLATEDAHGLYKQFGFCEVKNPSINMERLIKPEYLTP
jgi:N-acetylglutamate synthase-like GNAT family acetyltransferase